MPLVLEPKHKRPAGQPPPAPPARPTIDPARADRLAGYAKALSDPIRVQLVDVLRDHPGQLCACELLPLFEITQSTLSHHLKKLHDARILDVHRSGLWAYYYVRPEALDDLGGWLVPAASVRAERGRPRGRR
jgi:ArsR family transcriptional regulator, arsenate/arsenite/antimonite-responsive transcriptional repressor